MPRSSNNSDSAEAAVRAHFGLSQRQLARFLGVSVGFVSHLEAGRKQPALVHTQRLTQLALLLPPPEGFGPPDALAPVATPENPAALPDGPATPLAPEPLRARQRDCRLQAATLQQQLLKLQRQAAALARRRRGLAQLQAAPLPFDPAEAAHRTRWLAELADDLAGAEFDPAAAASAQVLLAVRLATLLGEAEALGRLLGE